MDAWIAGAERLSTVAAIHEYREPFAPWRKVWHSMEATEDDPDTPNVDEGWEPDQARAYIRNHPNPPHIWALFEHDLVFQTVPLTMAARALVHTAGTPETNHKHAVQTEVMTVAARNFLTRPDVCEWLGRRVLGPIIRAGVPIKLADVTPSDDSRDAYGASGSVRLSWSWWASFAGQCGHQNVPGNVHADPGRADYTLIARHAIGLPPTPRPSHQEMPEMFTYGTAGKPVFFCHAGKSVGLNEATDLAGMRKAHTSVGAEPLVHYPLDDDTYAKFRERFPGA